MAIFVILLAFFFRQNLFLSQAHLKLTFILYKKLSRFLFIQKINRKNLCMKEQSQAGYKSIN